MPQRVRGNLDILSDTCNCPLNICIMGPFNLFFEGKVEEENGESFRGMAKSIHLHLYLALTESCFINISSDPLFLLEPCSACQTLKSNMTSM